MVRRKFIYVTRKAPQACARPRFFLILSAQLDSGVNAIAVDIFDGENWRERCLYRAPKHANGMDDLRWRKKPTPDSGRAQSRQMEK